jgi:hypothetical protein
LTDVELKGSACERPSTRSESSSRRFAVAWLGTALLTGIACNDATLYLVSTDVGNPDAGAPDLGLLAHWALDESQPGDVVVDSSGFGHSGQPSQNPPVPTDDVPLVGFQDRYSLSFNGQDQWIEIGNPGLLNLGGPISVAAWLRATSVAARGNIVAHGYRFGPSYDFALRVDAGSYVFTTWDGVNHQAIAAISSDDVGTWVHLCGVFDGNGYQIYRNGSLAAATVDATPPQSNVETNWVIGASAQQDNLMQGSIDDIRIYGRALSAAEVEALYRR